MKNLVNRKTLSVISMALIFASCGKDDQQAPQANTASKSVAAPAPVAPATAASSASGSVFKDLNSLKALLKQPTAWKKSPYAVTSYPVVSNTFSLGEYRIIEKNKDEGFLNSVKNWLSDKTAVNYTNSNSTTSVLGYRVDKGASFVGHEFGANPQAVGQKALEYITALENYQMNLRQQQSASCFQYYCNMQALQTFSSSVLNNGKRIVIQGVSPDSSGAEGVIMTRLVFDLNYPLAANPVESMYQRQNGYVRSALNTSFYGTKDGGLNKDCSNASANCYTY